MNNPPGMYARGTVCGLTALLSGIPQQALAASAAQQPQAAALGAMVPEDFAVLVWAPVLLLTLLCVGGLLLLILRQGHAAARRSRSIEAARPRRRRSRLGTIGGLQPGNSLRF